MKRIVSIASVKQNNHILIFVLFLCIFILSGKCLAVTASQINRCINTPMRGNALDIHFSNFTAFNLKVSSYFFDNSKTVPSVNERNIFFIPNSGSKTFPEEMPVTFCLKPAYLYKSSKYILKAQSFIQSLLIYNNIISYRKNKLYNGGYDKTEKFTTYSSFMWSQGVRAPDDGENVFKNAMEEINNLKYKFSMNINENLKLSMDLIFKAKSNLITKNNSKKIPPELKRLRDINVIAGEIAAFTKMAGGILHMLTNPPAGILITISGAFNEVQALSLYMINSYVGENLITQAIKGDSWLSTPFNIVVKPENYFIENNKGEVIDIADYNIQNNQIIFYLGNNNKPQYIKVDFTSTLKGDLFISFISSSIIKNKNSKSFIKNSEFKIKENKSKKQ